MIGLRMTSTMRVAYHLAVALGVFTGLLGWSLYFRQKPTLACHDFAQGGRICIAPRPLSLEEVLVPPKRQGATVYCTTVSNGMISCK